MTEASQLGPSDDATVVLDIGGDVGALIIVTGSEQHLVEIEVSRVDGGPALPGSAQAAHTHDHAHEHGHAHTHDSAAAPRTHVAVRERRGSRGLAVGGHLPELLEGDYVVWGADGDIVDRVAVVGGKVSELDWR